MILDKTSKTPLYLQIYERFKHQILEGIYLANDKIPSIRSLSNRYEVSKNTVEKAYQQLLVEGFIEAIPKSGYVVSVIKPLHNVKDQKTLKIKERTYINLNQSKDLFDIEKLRKLYNETFFVNQTDLVKPVSPTGETFLKEAIHRLVSSERGGVLTPSQVVVSSGLQNQLVILASILRKKRLAYLVPIFKPAKQILNDLNFTLIPCHTIDEMVSLKPDLIYISPSNLYPSGDILPISDRMKLINYALNQKAYIIEDDYNHIYRYNAAIIPSIQGLAKGLNVIYINSFSRTYLVSMRLSYMILPNDLLELYSKKPPYSQTVSKIDQLVMANWIKLGHHQKHLKKLTQYAKKQNDMISEVLNQVSLKGVKKVYGLKSNLHILFELSDSITKNNVLSKAKKHHIFIETFDELPLTILVPYNHIDKPTFLNLLNALF
ncbi:MAG: PLP-dependent aminotransferase family protein [Candidatus Izemoplasmataceae bacterium]